MSFLILHIPVYLCGIVGEGNVELPEKEVNLRVNNPTDIECYYPAYHQPASMIVMRSGKEFITKLTCEQMDTHIAGYYSALAKQMQKDTMQKGILIPSGN